jgi:Cdc6-like AAA superfamily ATPase
MEAKLFSNKQATALAITGAAGIGKSQMALELAYTTRLKNKDCSVFWIDASNIERLHQAYLYIAQKLNLPGWSDDSADVRVLVNEHCQPWCLFCDYPSPGIGPICEHGTFEHVRRPSSSLFPRHTLTRPPAHRMYIILLVSSVEQSTFSYISALIRHVIIYDRPAELEPHAHFNKAHSLC